MLSRKDIPSRLPRFDDEHDVCNSMPDRPLRCIAWFWLFAVLVLSPPRRTVLVLVIDCLNRLASNAIFKALKNIRRRDICPIGLAGAFRVRARARRNPMQSTNNRLTRSQRRGSRHGAPNSCAAEKIFRHDCLDYEHEHRFTEHEHDETQVRCTNKPIRPYRFLPQPDSTSTL
jgi:hypothetical protein